MKLRNLLFLVVLFSISACGKSDNENLADKKKLFIYEIIRESIKEDGGRQDNKATSAFKDNKVLSFVTTAKKVTAIFSIKNEKEKNPYEGKNKSAGKKITTDNGDEISVEFIKKPDDLNTNDDTEWRKDGNAKVEIKDGKVHVNIVASSPQGGIGSFKLTVTPKGGKSGSDTFTLLASTN